MRNITEERINVGDIVRHFKRETLMRDGKYAGAKYLYKIIAFAEHTETKERMVVYQALYSDKDLGVKMFDYYCRPYDMFMSEVDKDKYPNIKQRYRFEVMMSKNDLDTRIVR